MWRTGKEEFPEVLSAVKLCELLLTPHGNTLSGLQHGAWTLQEDEGKCSCTPSSMEVDCLEELLSCTTSSTNIVDADDTIDATDTVDASGAPFAFTDVRMKDKEGIKLTLKIPKKKKNKKKKNRKPSPPPPKSSSPPAPPSATNPSTSTSSSHDSAPAKKKIKQAGLRWSQTPC